MLYDLLSERGSSGDSRKLELQGLHLQEDEVKPLYLQQHLLVVHPAQETL